MTKSLKNKAKIFFKRTKSIRCPAFPKEEIVFNSKGLSHLFYKGANKVFARSSEETKVRVLLLPSAVKILAVMPLPQEESTFIIGGKRVKYWAFEAVVDNRRIKVVVRQVGKGKKHFWSVIPGWRRTRGRLVNARGNLSRQ